MANNQTSEFQRAVQRAEQRISLALAKAHLCAIEEVLPATDVRENLAFELYLKVQAEEHYSDVLEETFDREDSAAWRQEFERTHTWLQSCGKGCGRDECSPMVLAQEMIREYIDVDHAREFSYSDVINPEGISDEDLDKDCEASRNRMMAALSALPDDDMTVAIASVLARDHDGSRYAITKVQHVREWQVKYGDLTIAEARQIHPSSCSREAAPLLDEEMMPRARG